MKFDDLPRLPKLPFILGDIVLLALAFIIGDQHPAPFTALPLFLIAGCVALGCVLAVVPFIVNYVRDREEAAAALRRELSEQFKKLMTASEHLQNATAALKTAEETAAKNVQAAEQLPFRMQEKIADFTKQLAETDRTQKEATEQELAALRAAKSEHLATIADRIVKAAAEYTKLEGAARRQLEAAGQLEPKLASLLASIDAKVAALSSAVQMADRLFSKPPMPVGLPETPGSVPPIPPAPAAPPAPIAPVALAAPAAVAVPAAAAGAPAPAAPPPPAAEVAPPAPAASASASPPPLEPARAPSAPVAAGSTPGTPVAAGDSTPPVAGGAPRKPRAPRKPKAEEAAVAAAPSAVAADPTGNAPGAIAAAAPNAPGPKSAPELIVEPLADEPPAPDDFSQVPPDENRPAAAPSPDGFTRLTVVSYIGIGNKLYLRGEGPGLSWDKGVPLQFVSIGRWRWETAAATGPVTCKILKNDKLEAPVGRLTLKQGTEQEITAAF